MNKQNISQLFPTGYRELIQTELEKKRIEEIRIRIGQPMELIGADCRMRRGDCWTQRELEEFLSFASTYSLYAYEEQIRQGYLTIKGGHRLGLCGQVVCVDNHVQYLKFISSVNVRIATEHKGIAKPVVPYLLTGNQVENTLLVSPPGVGKTTLLRDLVRLLSVSQKKVAVIDERSEIAACENGVPQNDLGPCTDVLEGCPKEQAIPMLLRTMSPEVIVLDELGGEKEEVFLNEILNRGCSVLATIHGVDYDSIRNRCVVQELLKRQQFGRVICLHKGNDGARECIIYNALGRKEAACYLESVEV